MCGYRSGRGQERCTAPFGLAVTATNERVNVFEKLEGEANKVGEVDKKKAEHERDRRRLTTGTDKATSEF